MPDLRRQLDAVVGESGSDLTAPLHEPVEEAATAGRSRHETT